MCGIRWAMQQDWMGWGGQQAVKPRGGFCTRGLLAEMQAPCESAGGGRRAQVHLEQGCAHGWLENLLLFYTSWDAPTRGC